MSESLPELCAPRTRRHQESIDAAARAAARAGFSASLFRDSVLGVRDDIDTYARALHVVEQRTVHLHTIPGPGRSQGHQRLPSPESVDPWAVDVDALPDATRVLAWCPTCLGSGAAQCPSCRGTGKTRCIRCNGVGTDARGVECAQCGGTKKLPCAACKAGQIPCATCNETGEVIAHLDVQRDTRKVVCVFPMGAAARAHPRVTEVEDFDLDPSCYVATRVEDTGMRPPGEIPHELLPTRLKAHERVVASRLQRFQATRCLVVYGTALATGVVPVAGSPPEVDATADWRPIELRRNVTLVFAAVTLALGIFFGVSHTSRHPWYAQGEHTTLLLALSGALALATTVTFAGMLLAKPARTPMRTWVPAGAQVLLAGALALTLSRARPRAAHASASLDAGDLVRAALEADALRALDIDRDAGESILDRVRLRRLAQAPTLDSKATVARGRWYREAYRREAYRAMATAIEEASGSADDARLEALASLAREFAPPLQERLLRDVALRRARRCAEEGDGQCTRTETLRALQHGAEPSQTDPLLVRARARCAESFRVLIARVDGAAEPAVRAEALRAAIARSEGCTALTREPTTPPVEVLRTRLIESEARSVSVTGAHHSEAPQEPSRHRRR